MTKQRANEKVNAIWEKAQFAIKDEAALEIMLDLIQDANEEIIWNMEQMLRKGLGFKSVADMIAHARPLLPDHLDPETFSLPPEMEREERLEDTPG